MQICTNCLRELFDSDSKCDICGCERIISNKFYLKIKKELETVNSFKRKKLIKDYPYNSVYKYITSKYGERYWKEIKRKPNSDVLLYSSEMGTKPTITCPYCNSTDTKKISTTSKFINTALFGIFGTKRYKQWHCNHCGSDF